MVKSLLRRVGYDVVRFDPESSDLAKIVFAIRHLQTDLVLDVGAGDGQYAGALRACGYRGRIVSFEPLAGAHRRLQRQAADDAAWTVHPRCAVGDRSGSATLHVAANGVSSSLLPMLPLHAEAEPGSAYVGTEQVALVRLDDVAPAFLSGAASPLLKIDTQGTEDAVLRGAEAVLQSCRAVQLEMSVVPLYAGAPAWEALIATLRTHGFEPWTLLPGFVDRRNGRTLQIDAIFVRGG